MKPSIREVIAIAVIGVILYGINMYDRWAIRKITHQEQIEQRQKQLSEPKFIEPMEP